MSGCSPITRPRADWLAAALATPPTEVGGASRHGILSVCLNVERDGPTSVRALTLLPVFRFKDCFEDADRR